MGILEKGKCVEAFFCCFVSRFTAGTQVGAMLFDKWWRSVIVSLAIGRCFLYTQSNVRFSLLLLTLKKKSMQFIYQSYLRCVLGWSNLNFQTKVPQKLEWHYRCLRWRKYAKFSPLSIGAKKKSYNYDICIYVFFLNENFFKFSCITFDRKITSRWGLKCIQMVWCR